MQKNILINHTNIPNALNFYKNNNRYKNMELNFLKISHMEQNKYKYYCLLQTILKLVIVSKIYCVMS